jgi:hypothetical protein
MLLLFLLLLLLLLLLPNTLWRSGNRPRCRLANAANADLDDAARQPLEAHIRDLADDLEKLDVHPPPIQFVASPFLAGVLNDVNNWSTTLITPYGSTSPLS